MINLSQIENMEFEGVDFSDYPDFVDAYLISADYDGKEMTEEQMLRLPVSCFWQSEPTHKLKKKKWQLFLAKECS